MKPIGKDILYLVVVNSMVAITGAFVVFKHLVLYNLNLWEILYIPAHAALEEFIFRLILISVLVKYLNIYLSLIISAILFAFSHFVFTTVDVNLLLFTSKLIGGLYFGWAYISTKKLFIPTLLHALINFINAIFIKSEYDLSSNTINFNLSIHLLIGVFVISYYKLPKKFNSQID